MLGTLPVFLGVVILRRFEMVSMALHLIGYTLLCVAIVKLTSRLLWAAKRRASSEVTFRD
jgi:hypothetical protein